MSRIDKHRTVGVAPEDVFCWPQVRGDRSFLSKELSVDQTRLARRLETELLIQGSSELVVSASDRLAQPERAFGLEREAPERLVELVQRKTALCGRPCGRENSASLGRCRAAAGASYDERE